MPRYDFKCKECEKEFELSLYLRELDSESEKKQCPECSSKDIAQVLNRSASVLRYGQSKSVDTPPCAGGGKCPSGGCGI